MRLMVDDKLFMKQMNNLIKYGNGFVEGVQLGKKSMLDNLGLELKVLLEEYIDSNARMNPAALQHVYEWYQNGTPSGRLFDVKYVVTNRGISFGSSFSQSKSIKHGSNTPFYDKATIMEGGMTVTIAPKNSNVLAFDDNGETVFTSKPVTVSNPGGVDAQGSYEETYKEFFTRYLSQSFLQVSGLAEIFGNPTTFKRNLAAGLNGGRPVGVAAGKKWVTSKGSVA